MPIFTLTLDLLTNLLLLSMMIASFISTCLSFHLRYFGGRISQQVGNFGLSSINDKNTNMVNNKKRMCAYMTPNYILKLVIKINPQKMYPCRNLAYFMIWHAGE